jgi:sulfite exporter TauE/SafE
MNKAEKNSFVDIKFFLGVLLIIYGLILFTNGLYYQFTNTLTLSANIDFLYGIFLSVLGAIFYRASSKPAEWTRAFGHSGIERIEKRLKWPKRI